MRITTAALAAAITVSIIPGARAAATDTVSLKGVATRTGFTYAWLGEDDSVCLSRPGTVIVLRPGDARYEVNLNTQVADIAPRYSNGDLLISPALSSHLVELARASHSAERITIVVGTSQQASGVLTLDARPQPGTEGVLVTGQAPTASPVTITLLATLSSDLPTVVVSRQDVQPDVNGRFGAVIPIAPDYSRGSILEVLATATGAAPASAQVLIGAPNAGATVPFERSPRSAR